MTFKVFHLRCIHRRYLVWNQHGHFFPVAGLEFQGWCFLAANVLLPDFPEGRAKPLNAESIDDWVDCRVSMSEQDGNIKEDYGLLAFGAEESDAVDDVEREPADGEEKKNQNQRFGKI